MCCRYDGSVLDAAAPGSGDAEVSLSGWSACLAGILIAIGSCVRGPVRFALGLTLVLIGVIVGARAVWLVGSPRRTAWKPAARLLLVAMAIVGVFTPSLPAVPAFTIASRAFFGAGAAAAALLWTVPRRWRRRMTLALLVAASALHLATPLAVPDPRIDVFLWVQTCLTALVHGVHPYTVQVVTSGQTAPVYPYMPLTLVAFLPAFALFGDCRYGSALAMIAGFVLNRVAGRRLGAPDDFVDASTLALVLHPRGFVVTAAAWNEPLLVLALYAFVVLAVRRPGGLGQAIAFMLLPSLKQYVVAPVALFVGIEPPRQRPAIVAGAIGVAVAAFAPFLLWDWRATVHGITTQMITPAAPRLDSTSIVALVAVRTGWILSRWLSVAAQFGAAALAYRRLRHQGLGGVLLGSAVCLAATFVVGWQAFVNYYYFVTAAFIAASVVLVAPPIGAARAIGDNVPAAAPPSNVRV